MSVQSIARVQYLEAVLARSVLKFFLNPEIVGREHLAELLQCMHRQTCSTVIVANHINAYDPVYLSATISGIAGRQLYPVWLPAKKRFFDNPLKDRLMRLHGCLPLGIGKDEDSLRSMKEVIEKVRAGETICVFPEGQVSADGTPGKDLGFVTFLARRSSLLVLPVHLSGIVGFRTEWKPVLLRKRRLRIAFGQPVSVERGTVVDAMAMISAAGQ